MTTVALIEPRGIVRCAATVSPARTSAAGLTRSWEKPGQPGLAFHALPLSPSGEGLWVGPGSSDEFRPPASNSRPSIRFSRDYEYCGLMEEAAREVLEFIGDQGKTAEQVSDRFPAFDLERLVRAELARPRRTNPVKSQSRHTPADEHTFYVLTSRGAEAIGLAPYTLHSD